MADKYIAQSGCADKLRHLDIVEIFDIATLPSKTARAVIRGIYAIRIIHFVYSGHGRIEARAQLNL